MARRAPEPATWAMAMLDGVLSAKVEAMPIACSRCAAASASLRCGPTPYAEARLSRNL